LEYYILLQGDKNTLENQVFRWHEHQWGIDIDLDSIDYDIAFKFAAACGKIYLTSLKSDCIYQIEPNCQNKPPKLVRCTVFGRYRKPKITTSSMANILKEGVCF